MEPKLKSETKESTAPEVMILKSKIDNRTYKYLRLENEMQVLLIHDKEADKAAAAVDVNVG